MSFVFTNTNTKDVADYNHYQGLQATFQQDS